LWLKRTSTQNIVIGGAAGAVPVLVGWSAVTGTLNWAPLVMFAIIFAWTPPHFWALAVRYRDDYAAAGVPMLPAVRSLAKTAHQVLVYTAVLCVLTLVLVPVARLGTIYLVAALTLGTLFLFHAIKLVRQPTAQVAMRLFGYSITYLSLLFCAMALDQLTGH
ncbi:MAG: UbiA family prenyltransferase, partial [Mycobacterium sp.]